MSEDIVMIGDYLGTIEEFLPGDGTFAEEGKIYAARLGSKKFDSEKHMMTVEGKKLPTLETDQIVFGEVAMMRKNQVTVIVYKIQGIDTPVDEKTSIYVSNIDDKYVESPDDMFAIGDIVKAKVFKINDGFVDLSTKGDLGVVKAFCRRCRNSLGRSETKEGKMECPVCGHIELRKTAKDYGNVQDL